MWYFYWAAIVLVVLGTAVLAFKNPSVAGWLGKTTGQLTSNNNWRLVAMFIVSMILTVSAILSGFGRPILASSLEEAKTFVYENVAESNSIETASDKLSLAVSNIGKAFGFTNTTAAPPAKDNDKKAEKRYPSWWHWKLAGLSWICFFVYFPIATREELAAAVKKAWKQLKWKKRVGSIVNQPIVTNPGTSQETPGMLSGWFGKLFPRGGFSWHMLIEVLGDYLPAAVMRIIKKL